MSKIICPECEQQVEKCYWSECEFSENDRIICVGIRGKHFESEEHLQSWLIDKFEKYYQIVNTYAEREA
jgi:hypothetical protein